jgi:hypothetical protein
MLSHASHPKKRLMPPPAPNPDPTLKPFVYSWGLRSRARIPRRRSAIVITPLAAAIITYAAIHATNDPFQWVYAAIAAVVWVLALTFILHPLVTRRTNPASRIIRVHELRRVIEFQNAPIRTGLFSTRTLDHYECRIADLRAIKFYRGPIQPHLILDTPKGRIDITTRHDTQRLEELHLMLRDLANAPARSSLPEGGRT